MSLADPWCDGSTDSNLVERDATSSTLEFEDNFQPSVTTTSEDNVTSVSESVRQPQQARLPDSDSYLAILERKLKKIQTNPTVLQQLAERREACMQHLLNDVESNISDLDLLEEPLSNHELFRLIKPEQPLSVAELAHLVKHDHLEPAIERNDALRSEDAEEESGTESSTSR